MGHSTNQVTWGDVVRVQNAVEERYRPGELGSVCGLREIVSPAAGKGEHPRQPVVLCLVEFGDGEAIEIPQDMLTVVKA